VHALPPTLTPANLCHRAQSWRLSFRPHLQGGCPARPFLIKRFPGTRGVGQIQVATHRAANAVRHARAGPSLSNSNPNPPPTASAAAIFTRKTKAKPVLGTAPAPAILYKIGVGKQPSERAKADFYNKWRKALAAMALRHGTCFVELPATRVLTA